MAALLSTATTHTGIFIHDSVYEEGNWSSGQFAIPVAYVLYEIAHFYF